MTDAALDERVGGLFDVAQLGEVRDALRSLQRETKIRGRARGPSFKHRRLRHRAERVVDLDRRHPLGVVLEHLGGGSFSG